MMTDRPVSQWRLRPQQGEPSYSYFARLVAEDGHGSTKIYATEIGINGRNFVPEEMLHVLQELPLKDEEQDRLRNATPLLRNGFYHIGNERVREKQLSFRKRRFCPHCLADAPYHRIYWDVVSVTRCAVHGAPLVDDVDGKPLKWWWPHFDVSPEGKSMIDRTPASPDRLLPFHEMVRSRLDLGKREEGPLSGYDLCEIIEPARWFCRYQKDGKPVHPRTDKIGDIETGFALLLLPHADRVNWFSRWYETAVPAEMRRRGYECSSPSPSKLSGDRGNNELWEAVVQAQFEGFAKVGTLGRKSTLRSAPRSEKTLRETSKELGLPARGLAAFIRRLDLLPEAKWKGDAHSIDQATFEILKAVVDDLITLPKTTEITGITGTEFRRLAKAGYIREFGHMPLGGIYGPRYVRAEVRELVDHLRSKVKQPPKPGAKALRPYARSKGLTEGAVLVMTMEGTKKPTGGDLSKTGLRGLYFR